MYRYTAAYIQNFSISCIHIILYVQRFNANGIESICILEKILAIFSQLVYVICGFVNLKRVNIKDITLFVSFYYV